jgi:DNA-binding NarL/FixJ family response regulator
MEALRAKVAFHPAGGWLAGSGDDAGGRSPGSGPEASAEQGPARRRVLIVEDEWLVATQLQAYLRAGGFEVVGVAADAVDGLALAASERPELMVMDIRLAGPTDGIELAKEIRTRLDIPSLFVSGNLDAGTMARAASARPAGYVHKPFSQTELIRATTAAFAAMRRRP